MGDGMGSGKRALEVLQDACHENKNIHYPHQETK